MTPVSVSRLISSVARVAIAARSPRGPRVAALIACAAVAAAAPARAGIVLVTGSVQIVAPPFSVELDAFESDTWLQVFSESTGVVLPAALRVNFTAPGLYDDRSDLPTPVPRLAAGTRVDSYLVNADPETSGIAFTGSITFDRPILGIILGGVLLDESDGPLGGPTVYPFDFFLTGRGLALSGLDSVTLSSDLLTLSMSFRTRQLMDQVRIVTAAAVPEPFATALIAGGVGAVLVRTRRRQASARRL